MQPSPLPSNRVTAVVPLPDRAVFGTASGLFVMPDTGASFTVPGFSGFVTAAAKLNERFWVLGTLDGVTFIQGGVARPVRLPGPEDRQAVAALAVIPEPAEKIYAGGAFGLVEISRDGSVRPMRLPDGKTQVMALATNGVDLLVACDDILFVYRTMREEWKTLAAGLSYSALAFPTAHTAVAIRSSGDLERIPVGSAFLPGVIPLPIEDDYVTALHTAAAENLVVLWIGTHRGRVLRCALSGVDPDFRSWEEVIAAPTPAFSIRALATKGNGEILLALDGGGIRKCIPGAKGAIETVWLVAEADPLADPITPKEEARTPMEISWTDRLAELKRFIPSASTFRSLPGLATLKQWASGDLSSHTTLIFAALLTGFIVIVIAVWLLYKRLSSVTKPRLVERRRSRSQRKTVPSLDDLSPDVSGPARKMQELTERINELSKKVAKGETDSLGENTSEVMAAFTALDGQMRAHLAQLRMVRGTKQERIAEIRRTLKSGDSSVDTRELGEELDAIEAWMRTVEKDEQYLKYVLEE